MSIRKVISGRKFQFVRFLAVGVINTVVDFILFNIFILALGGHDQSSGQVIIANSFSATLAACMSFVLNKHYVFQKKHTPHHYVAHFILITLSGLYLIQNAVIYLSVSGLEGTGRWLADFLSEMSGATIDHHVLAVNLAKLLATAITVVWNYSLYKVLFKRVRDL